LPISRHVNFDFGNSEIRKWFSFNGLKAVGEPSKIKRPWLSIIKNGRKNLY
jgi:hypothetical protein